jgi:putative methionine-R-sulfoxide reductase with GAF domain
MTDPDFPNHGTHDIPEELVPSIPEQASSQKTETPSMENSSQIESARYRRGGMIFAMVWFFIMLVGSLFMAVNARKPGAIWQETILAIVYMMTTIIALFSFSLFRAGRMKIARTWLIASAYLAIFLSAILQYSGTASIAMSIVMPIGFSAGLGFLSLPILQAKRLIYVSFGLSVFCIILSFIPLPFRGVDTPSRDLGTPIGFVFGVLVIVLILTQTRPAVMWFMNQPIRTKLIGLIAGLSLLTVGVLFSININDTRELLITNAVDEMSSLASSQADVYAEMLADRVNTMNAFAMVAANSPVLTAQNEAYQGSSGSTQTQIEEKDSQWATASDYDALIRGVLANDLAFTAKRFKEINRQMFIEVFITDRYGANVAAADRTSNYYQADEDWWQAAYNGGQGAVYIGDIEYDANADVWGFNIAVPIFSQTTNEVVGILRTTALFDQFFSVMGKALSETASANIVFPSGLALDEEGNLHILAEGELGTTIRKGELYLEMPEMQARLSENELQTLANYVVNPSDTGVGAPLFTKYCSSCHINNIPSVANFDQAYETITSGGHHATTPVGSEDLYTASVALSSNIYPFVGNTGWRIIIYEPESSIIVPVRQQTTTSILIALGLAVVIGGAAVFIARRITNPITNLTHLARELASGNYNVLAEVTTTDEVGQLSSAFNTMASEVALRDKTLAARARAAETSAQVSRRLSTILNRDQLVTEVVEQLQQAFGYYHAHIYLVDENTRDLVMVGGTGEPGRQMLAAGHKIPWGRGLTGRAAESNAVVLVPDTSQEEDWLPNPLLPETKAEIAVPIALGDRVLGVLDVQHNEVGGLGENDQTMLVSIAGQVAIALQNVHLMEDAQNHARRQSLIYEITQRIQGATSVKDAMQIAVREVGRALDVEETVVKLS